MVKFATSFGIITLGLALGIALRLAVESGRLSLPFSIETLRKSLQKIALLFLNPVAIVGAVWVVSFSSPRLAAIPLIGLFALLLGGILALGAAALMGLAPRQKGAFFGCGSYANIGSIGALVCFVYLGEPGFALVPLYKVFEEVYYYGVGFPVARFFSTVERETVSTGNRLTGLIKDPFIITAVSSLVLGGLFNYAGIPRPAIYASINSIFIPLATILLLTSIGLALKFRKVRQYRRECLSVSLIKFILVPAAATTAALLLGYRDIDGGLPLKVVLILSSMPVAFNALIPPSIYDLDLDLANSCWFVTTALLVVVLPALVLLVGIV